MLKFVVNYKVWLLVVGFGISGNFAIADNTWTGAVDTDWNNGGNWTNGSPGATIGDGTNPISIVIGNGAVVQYNLTPIGDFVLNDQATVMVNGSWTQMNGAWPNFYAGSTLNIGSGGSFDLGAAGVARNFGTIAINNGSFTIASGEVQNNAGSVFSLNGGSASGSVFTNNGTLNLSGGTFSFSTFNPGTGMIHLSGNGSLNTAGTVSLSTTNGITLTDNAVLTVGNEFKPEAYDFTMQGGILNVTALISFTNTGSFILEGGTLNILNANNEYNGIYQGASGFLDIMVGSSDITFSVASASDMTALLGSSKLGLNGVQGASLADFETAGFVLNGNTLSYVAPIPEPSAIALLVIGGLTLAGTAYRKRQWSKK
jgi:hypothetical protein